MKKGVMKSIDTRSCHIIKHVIFLGIHINRLDHVIGNAISYTDNTIYLNHVCIWSSVKKHPLLITNICVYGACLFYKYPNNNHLKCTFHILVKYLSFNDILTYRIQEVLFFYAITFFKLNISPKGAFCEFFFCNTWNTIN